MNIDFILKNKWYNEWWLDGRKKICRNSIDELGE